VSGIKSLGKPSDRCDTQCKRCGFGIFNRQPHVWQNGPKPGLVHPDCDNPNGAAK
jgi:hypothetical protein